jgi:hypothetical protein
VRISTWYQSTCSERKLDIRSIVVDSISIKSIRYLIRSITNRKKSKDRFQGSKSTEEKLGFQSFMELCVGSVGIGTYIHNFIWR